MADTGIMSWGLTQTKAGFFDRKAIESDISKRERQRLSKLGAFIRRRAKSSIRKRKKASPPGKPPSSHTGVLRNFIFFAYDAERRMLVVGPIKTNQRNAFAIRSRRGIPTIPSVLEYGGVVGIHEVLIGDKWVRRNFRVLKPGKWRGGRNFDGSLRPTRIRTAKYPARPYMGPAGRAEAGAGREWLRALVR